MSDTRAPGDATPEVLVYGASTCEDTAIARSRLRALGIPFREVDIDEDPAGLARVIALEGHRVTPTIVLGDGGAVIAEPSLEQLDEAIRAVGGRIDPPGLDQVPGVLAERPIPLRTLPRVDGDEVSLETTRGHHGTAIFFAHGAACLACHGYAKQLARQADALRDADAMPVVVVRDTPEAARRWLEEMPGGAWLLADRDGAWWDAVRGPFATDPGGVMLLVLDRWAAPRAASAADEAGGLPGPAAATEWGHFLALECPECGNDVRWPG